MNENYDPNKLYEVNKYSRFEYCGVNTFPRSNKCLSYYMNNITITFIRQDFVKILEKYFSHIEKKKKKVTNSNMINKFCDSYSNHRHYNTLNLVMLISAKLLFFILLLKVNKNRHEWYKRFKRIFFLQVKREFCMILTNFYIIIFFFFYSGSWFFSDCNVFLVLLWLLQLFN